MDAALFSAINGLAGHVDGIDDLFELTSRAVPYLLVALLLGMWFWPASRPRRDRLQVGAIAATLAAAVALGVNQAIVHLWDRPRQFATHPVTLLLAPSHDPSFPSDHAAFGFAVAVAVYLASRRLGLVALLLATLLAFSRVYTGEHYVSDVLAGALIGAVAALGAARLVPRLEPLLDPPLRLARRLHLA